FGRSPVQERLSCLAKDNSIYIVENIGDKKPCNASDPQCPPDGRYQYNTDVVFDSEGRLVARYHKKPHGCSSQSTYPNSNKIRRKTAFVFPRNPAKTLTFLDSKSATCRPRVDQLGMKDGLPPEPRAEELGMLTGQCNLFAPEIQFDFPKDSELVTFDSPFGKFGIFTCFDIFSHDLAVMVVEEFQVDSILYPTAWYNTLPLLSAVPFHSAWARALGVNLLAANTHNTSMHMTRTSPWFCPNRFSEFILYGIHFQGSGIYSPEAVKVYYYDMETESGQLMLSELKSWPRREAIYSAAVHWSTYARGNFRAVFCKLSSTRVQSKKSISHHKQAQSRCMSMHITEVSNH
ncbi:Vascular non-inflammatory molecule 3, partial [Eschrichtius robustus]|nr:Vascular non-inflammatory molecule 3 [Eschrichtius robustus]